MINFHSPTYNRAMKMIVKLTKENLTMDDERRAAKDNATRFDLWRRMEDNRIVIKALTHVIGK